MGLQEIHILLIKEPDYQTGRRRVINFFAKNFLVKYDNVQVVDKQSFPASEAGFWQVMEKGISDNKKNLAKLVNELKESGFTGVDNLINLPQGYESKIFHTIAHLLDGFFGIDTSFYNLEEDSHWLSDELAETIRVQPGNFRVFTVECSSESGSGDLLVKLRKFETGF